MMFSVVCHIDKAQATLSLGMDLNLDWMTLDDFQKHLNGEDEILSGPPLSPSESFNFKLQKAIMIHFQSLFNVGLPLIIFILYISKDLFS